MSSRPNYDLHSFNAGYAHTTRAQARFIDFVAIQEKVKHVTIVLNQDSETMRDLILTPERVSFLQRWGYTAIRVIGQTQSWFMLRAALPERTLTIVAQPTFSPSDMKWLQLAAERLLATGDNSATEAWAARCKFYMYEVHGIFKHKFLQQQVEVARRIRPELGEILELGAKSAVLSEEEMARCIEILQEPALADATLQFCRDVINNYSFQEILEGALKRTAWHHVLPHLIDEEADAMDDEFKIALPAFLRNVEARPQTIQISNLAALSRCIERLVQEHFNT